MELKSLQSFLFYHIPARQVRVKATYFTDLMFTYFKRNRKIFFLSLIKERSFLSICSCLFAKEFKTKSSISKINLKQGVIARLHVYELNWQLTSRFFKLYNNIRVNSSLVFNYTARFRRDISGQIRMPS